MIYLDYNATTPLDSEVCNEIFDCLKNEFGNPSSSHLTGQSAKARIEKARASIAELIGCNPEEIYFTSGGTESNNLAILGTAYRYRKGHIITSKIEHPSVMNPVRYLAASGFEVTYAGVDKNGIVSVEEIKRAIRKDTILITIMHSNNETGAIQPVEDIAAVAKAHGILFHTDAAQSIGKIPVDTLNIDIMTIVPHKFYGPKGTGALFIRKGAEPYPIMFGAGHERGLRPGTENVPAIAGMGKACEIAKRDIKARTAHLTHLKNLLLDELQKNIEGIRINGNPELCLPNTLNVCISGIDAVDLVEALKDKVAISAGSACHAGVKSPSQVLKAMGLTDEDAMSSIRISLGKDNTEEDIRTAVKILSDAIPQLDRAR
jgi:cysteine desulfurase